MLDGAKFYMTECENVSTPMPDGEPLPPLRLLTALVCFARSNAERAAFRPLLTALSFGQTTSGVCAGSEWLAKLSERLVARAKPAGLDCVTVVLHIGSEADLVAETLQATVHRLNDCFGGKLDAIVAVRSPVHASSHQFADVRKLTGFVTGASGDATWGARSLFMRLAMFTAPRSLNGLDLHFPLTLLGTASEPSIMVEALWFRDGSRRLAVTSHAGEDVLRQSSGIAVIPVPTSEWVWDELGRLFKAVGAAAVESATNLVFAAHAAVTLGLLSTGVFMVLMLCTRSAAKVRTCAIGITRREPKSSRRNGSSASPARATELGYRELGRGAPDLSFASGPLNRNLWSVHGHLSATTTGSRSTGRA